MNMYDIILKKRNGGHLNREELKFFVEGYTRDLIPDYQASALLMTFFFHKLNGEEIMNLTNAMRDSGDIIDLSEITGIKVDKHSTGGVGDKTSLIVAPIAAAAGVPIAKMSGRGLGFTGGTIDKLESIPGFRTELTEDEFILQVNDIGISIIGQTGTVAPADKKIYALRDVTATVDDLGLIASSVMSKKLASGSDAIVLDVKCGSGAFMNTIDEATALADLCVRLGKKAGKSTYALVTDMSQPLGFAIGNSCEVMEAIDMLKGQGSKDLGHLCLTLASLMIFAGGMTDSALNGYNLAHECIQSGAALHKFREMIEAQGGDPGITEDFGIFPAPEYLTQVHNDETRGYVTSINAEKIGMASQAAGAGRQFKDETIDLSAGIRLYKKVGDLVSPEQPLMEIFGNDRDKINEAAEIAKTAFEFSDDEPAHKDIILKDIQQNF